MKTTTPPDAGFATASALGVVTALTVMIAALVSAARIDLVRTRMDILIAGDHAAAVGGLMFGTAELAEAASGQRRDGARQSFTVDIGGRAVSVVIASEGAKLDVNTAPEDQLAAALDDVLEGRADSVELASEIATLREASGAGGLASLDDIIAFDGFTGGREGCVRETLTPFGGALQFEQRRQGDGAGIRRPSPGSVVTVRAFVDQDGRPRRGVTAVMLVTGQPRDPVWTLEWRRFADVRMEECHAG